MAVLKKYDSFEAMKMDEKAANSTRLKTDLFSEFENFLKRLQSKFYNKSRKSKNGKQSGR